jgi:hypothetical protein
MLLHCGWVANHTKHWVFLHLPQNSLLLLVSHSLRHFSLVFVQLIFLSLFLLWIEATTLLKHIFWLWLFLLFLKYHFLKVNLFLVLFYQVDHLLFWHSSANFSGWVSLHFQSLFQIGEVAFSIIKVIEDLKEVKDTFLSF